MVKNSIKRFGKFGYNRKISMIKLSIIVPIYGVEQYIRKCVDSLLAQDMPFSEYEIILVDDESPDACPDRRCERGE